MRGVPFGKREEEVMEGFGCLVEAEEARREEILRGGKIERGRGIEGDKFQTVREPRAVKASRKGPSATRKERGESRMRVGINLHINENINLSWTLFASFPPSKEKRLTFFQQETK